jgi:hypothetical protein
VKTLVISISILLIASFSITPAFGKTDANSPQPQAKEAPAKEPEVKKTVDANKVITAPADANKITAPAADANKTTVANEITYPNAVRAEIAKYAGLDSALEKIDKSSENEIKEWTKGKLDDRLDLVLAVRKQITEELTFLKELAVKEGAVKTAAAIDGVLLARQERLKGVTEELEKESKRFRAREDKRKEQQERSTSGRTREPSERIKRETPPRTSTTQRDRE